MDDIKENSLIERLIKERPKFHVGLDGARTSWALSADALRFIYSTLTSDMTTLETGAGQSTVVFAIANTKHTCVTPSETEVAEIKRYCSELGVGNNIGFLIGDSDLVLPCNEKVPPELDFVLIDGSHRFPCPCIDWYYGARKLRVGGIVGVDDFEMPSVRVLFDFLKVEEDWRLVKTTHYTAFFKKVMEPAHPYYWRSQRFNTDYKPGHKTSLVNRMRAWAARKWRNLG